MTINSLMLAGRRNLFIEKEVGLALPVLGAPPKTHLGYNGCYAHVDNPTFRSGETDGSNAKHER